MDLVNKSVKKIQFITHYSDLYGANRSLLTIIEDLHKKKGFEVNILLPFKGSMVDELKKKGIPHSTFPYYGTFLFVRFKWKYLLLPLVFFLNVLVLPIIIYKIRIFNPTIIYSNTSAENLGLFISKIIRRKHIQHVREFMSLDYKSKFKIKNPGDL